LFLYTDGVTEAINAEDEMYGDDHLYNTMQKFNEYPLFNLVQTMNQSVSRFEGKWNKPTTLPCW
jgi:serine phosphatase RsbU (regulator of sigma subunit)